MDEGKPVSRNWVRDFLSMTRIPFAFTQTLFIALGFLYSDGEDYFKLLLGVLALGPLFIYGGVYILNDLADKEADREHPKKKHRVITSGRINAGTAVALATALIAAGFITAFHLGAAFTVICLLVLVNNMVYSYKPRLKDRLYLGLLSCSLNYPFRFLAGASIVSLDSSTALPALLFFLIALNGFSAYRIYDIKSKTGVGFKKEVNLAVVVRASALTAILIAVANQFFRNPVISFAIAGYMLFFSEVNLRIVRQGVDFFQLLRIRKTLRQKPHLTYYPVMVAVLAAVVVYVTLNFI